MSIVLTAPPAYGAGFAPAPTVRVYMRTPPAYGAGYGSTSVLTTHVTPITPVDPGFEYTSRARSGRVVPVVTPPLAPVPPAGHPVGPATPVAPATPAVALRSIPRVSETMPAPVVVAGIPYNAYDDSVVTPWTPSSIVSEVWAKQLQLIVSGQDVTYFRNLPTMIEGWTSQEPFGDASSTFVLPGVTSFDGLRQPVALPTGGVVGIAGTYTGKGYWQASITGLVIPYGDASFFGDALGLLNQPISGIAAHPTKYGYAMCAGDGGVFCYGAVPFEGSLPSMSLVPPSPIVGIACTKTGNGYWLVDAQGQVYAFGDAAYHGNAAVGYPTNSAVGIVCSSGGDGYIVAASNGGVFALGDAVYQGNGIPTYIAPYVGISSAPGITGYVLTNTLGRAYAFGSDVYEGGVSFPLNLPANSIAVTPTGLGYWISAGDGGVFAYGDAPFLGSVPSGGTTDYGSLSWLTLGAPMQINYIDASNVAHTLFEGVIADWEDSVSTGAIGLGVQCVGVCFQLDWYVAKPIVNPPFIGYSPTTGEPIFGWDAGHAIAQAINTVANPGPGTAIGSGPTRLSARNPFNGHMVTPVTTGVLTVQQPAWDKLLSSYITGILAQAQNFGGAQYTVVLKRPRTPVIQKKNLTGINWTVSCGARGIAHALSLDITTGANAIYGQGTAPPVLSTVGGTTSGLVGSWSNAQYPRAYVGDPPVFPLGSGDSFAPGDGQTGLSPFSGWMRQSGWPLVSQDTYVATNAALAVLDYYLILRFQVQIGLEPTGLVNAATWNAAFIIGTNTGAITNSWYAPLWQLPEVDPYTWSASGAAVGNNPVYNPSIPRVERYENMGAQITKAQGMLSAEIEGNRIQVAAWNGTITLTADPQEGSRFEIIAGQNILLRFFHGRDVLFHVSAVSVDFQSLSVQLTVSSVSLDLLTLAAMIGRDAEAFGVLRKARPNLVSLNISSNTTTFDAESSAGVVPPTLVAGNTWSVVRMPASESGSIAEVTLGCAGLVMGELVPYPFAVGVFSGPVTPDQLYACFGPDGPLVATLAGNNPWNDYALIGHGGGPGLNSMGLLYGAGGPGGACGYFPSDPSAAAPVLTGNYVDGSTWPYSSAPGYSPWLWVALWCANNCGISGRMLPAPPGG